MNRRIFVSQLSAGLMLQSIPPSLLAGSVSFIPQNLQTASWMDKAVELIQSGSLGTPQRLTIWRLYSPELTSLPTLQAMARQDFDMVSRLLKTNLAIDPNTLFIDSPSSRFGSYSTCFNRSGISLTWQGLARIGRQATRPTSTLQILGSQGVLQIAIDGGGYKLVNLRGQPVRADHGAGSLLTGSTQPSSFGG